MARRHAERDPLGEFGDGETPRRPKLGKNLPIHRACSNDYCR
jgi:hypothetical protein